MLKRRINIDDSETRGYCIALCQVTSRIRFLQPGLSLALKKRRSHVAHVVVINS